MTAGDFVSFMTALLMLYTPIKNIGKNFFGGIVSFYAIQEILSYKPYHWKTQINCFIRTLKYDNLKFNGNNELEWLHLSRILPTDTYRKFTMKEYITLSEAFKASDVRYNKKKDEFIDIKTK
jgi:hypothetical protein